MVISFCDADLGPVARFLPHPSDKSRELTQDSSGPVRFSLPGTGQRPRMGEGAEPEPSLLEPRDRRRQIGPALLVMRTVINMDECSGDGAVTMETASQLICHLTLNCN